jgi:hypothetical protein
LVNESAEQPDENQPIQRERDWSDSRVPKFVPESIGNDYEQTAAGKERSTPGVDGSPNGGNEREYGDNDRHTKE